MQSPHEPSERRIDEGVTYLEQRIAQRGLVLEAHCNILCCGPVGEQKQGASQHDGRPVIGAEVAWLERLAIEFRLRAHLFLPCRAVLVVRDRACGSASIGVYGASKRMSRFT